MFEVPFFGLSYRGKLDSYIDWSVYYYGCYEPEICELLSDLLQGTRDPLFLDVGANVGHHTLFAARLAAVHAFEPFGPVRESLMEKVDLNKLKNVTIHAYGLGEASAELPFFAPTGANLGVGSFVTWARADLTVPKLKVVRGDDLGLHPSVIKIDVEGFEAEVLWGLRETIERDRPAVLFEYSMATDHCAGLSRIRDAFPADYRFFQVHSRSVRYLVFEKAGYWLTEAKGMLGDILAIDSSSPSLNSLRARI